MHVTTIFPEVPDEVNVNIDDHVFPLINGRFSKSMAHPKPAWSLYL